MPDMRYRQPYPGPAETDRVTTDPGSTSEPPTGACETTVPDVAAADVTLMTFTAWKWTGTSSK